MAKRFPSAMNDEQMCRGCRQIGQVVWQRQQRWLRQRCLAAVIGHPRQQPQAEEAASLVSPQFPRQLLHLLLLSGRLSICLAFKGLAVCHRLPPLGLARLGLCWRCFGWRQLKFYCQLQPHTRQMQLPTHTRSLSRSDTVSVCVCVCARKLQRDIKLRVTFYFRCYVIHFRFVG